MAGHKLDIKVEDQSSFKAIPVKSKMGSFVNQELKFKNEALVPIF